MRNDENAMLKLIKEHKLYELFLDFDSEDLLEASGIYYKDDNYYIVADNFPHLMKLESTLQANAESNLVIRQRGENPGFEDITFNQEEQRFLVVAEAREVDTSENEDEDDEVFYQPMIEEFSLDLQYIQTRPLDFLFEHENKGIEGITYVCRNGQDYLFGLCEGNKCKGGKKGRKPGNGRILVFEPRESKWKLIEKIKLPDYVEFEDYSALDYRNDKLVIISQATSALWVGELREDEWKIKEEGMIYSFPRNEENEVIYCNVEGVTWITPTQLAFVSDMRKKGEQDKICKKKDQSIHVFDLPDA